MVNVSIVKSYYQEENGEFDLDKALILCGKFAGVCYDAEGYEHIKGEPIEKTRRRINLTKGNGHHSVYDHVYISFNIEKIPKILAMILNNEHEYTTSEKSARYTKIVKEDDSAISVKEAELYNKWMEILINKITEYANVIDKDKKYLTDSRIKKLAQENARYFVTVFMPTTFVYTTSLRQINYIYSWLKKYIAEHNPDDEFENKLARYMEELCIALEKLKVLDSDLCKNDKKRSISLFGKNLSKKEKYYGDVYATTYKGSFAQVAQAQRHRTLFYNIERLETPEYFVPPIIEDDESLVNEWLEDMKSVSDVTPQGEIVQVFERGLYEMFILKCKERLCTAAQLEIARQTKATLQEYYQALCAKNSDLAPDMEGYIHGARCTFKDYECNERCNLKEGINVTRKI